MNWYLGNYWYLSLLLLLPLLGFLMLNFVRWKNRRKDTFAESRFQETLFEKKSGFSKVLPVLYLIATLFLVLSIVDLLSGSEEVKTKQKMNNVIFLLDVSNSMNAQDVQPNRLDEAKNIIVQTMNKMTNDKVGIVVFAGEASSIMPLTTDFTAAESYIGGMMYWLATPPEHLVIAVAAFRILTFWLWIPIGWIALLLNGLFFGRSKRSLKPEPKKQRPTEEAREA